MRSTDLIASIGPLLRLILLNLKNPRCSILGHRTRRDIKQILTFEEKFTRGSKEPWAES